HHNSPIPQNDYTQIRGDCHFFNEKFLNLQKKGNAAPRKQNGWTHTIEKNDLSRRKKSLFFEWNVNGM
ncbi:MAG TPA: hypothetical protein H9896_05445, partial [Candidatus Pygmaiobacter gallistercoris]|nr:hypothetical protein [Candidatus Pygmaiobacter gallistercoris]